MVETQEAARIFEISIGVDSCLVNKRYVLRDDLLGAEAVLDWDQLTLHRIWDEEEPLIPVGLFEQIMGYTGFVFHGNEDDFPGLFERCQRLPVTIVDEVDPRGAATFYHPLQLAGSFDTDDELPPAEPPYSNPYGELPSFKDLDSLSSGLFRLADEGAVTLYLLVRPADSDLLEALLDTRTGLSLVEIWRNGSAYYGVDGD